MKSMLAFSKGSLRLSTMFIVFLFSIFAVSLIGARIAAAEDNGTCIPVHAEIQSTFVADECESPVGLCTMDTCAASGLLRRYLSVRGVGNEGECLNMIPRPSGERVG